MNVAIRILLSLMWSQQYSHEYRYEKIRFHIRMWPEQFFMNVTMKNSSVMNVAIAIPYS
jgi:hypothetical protein